MYSTQQFHCDVVRSVTLDKLDPSMLLGFLCATEAEFEDLCTLCGQVRAAICLVLSMQPGAAR